MKTRRLADNLQHAAFAPAQPSPRISHCVVAFVVAVMPAFGGAIFNRPGTPNVVDTGFGGSEQLQAHDDITGLKLFGTATGTKDCRADPANPGGDLLCSSLAGILWQGEGVDFFTRDYVELHINLDWLVDSGAVGSWNGGFFITINDQGNFQDLSVNFQGSTPDHVSLTTRIENIPIGAQLMTWYVTLLGTVGEVPESAFDRLTLQVPPNSIDINPVPSVPEPGYAAVLAGALWVIVSTVRRPRRGN